MPPTNVIYHNEHHTSKPHPRKCASIPTIEFSEINTEEKRKQWKSTTIKSCENFDGHTTFNDLYLGHTLFNYKTLSKVCEEWKRSYVGRGHVGDDIIEKVNSKLKLPPEEIKKCY